MDVKGFVVMPHQSNNKSGFDISANVPTNGPANSSGVVQPGRLEGVRSRRILAFILDYLIVGLFSIAVGISVFLLGIITLGAGWLLYFVLVPLVAITYVGLTLGGPNQATIGMQFFALRLERLDGGGVNASLAILHSILFWVAHVMLTPLMLAVSLFSTKKRLIQDILLGTVIVRSDV